MGLIRGFRHPETLGILMVGDRTAIEGPMRELCPPIVLLDYEGQPA